MLDPGLHIQHMGAPLLSSNPSVWRIRGILHQLIDENLFDLFQQYSHLHDYESLPGQLDAPDA